MKYNLCNRDQAGIWWFINVKALKIKNINKFLNQNKQNINWPNLEYFIHRTRNKNESGIITKKFDYNNKIKCKFCGVDYTAAKLKYNLTTKMIYETDKMLKHLGNQCPFTDRPDLKHSDCSRIYLPYRVCEDCYLLFETTNDIKNYQIKIANYFRIPVDPMNFGMYLNKKDEMDPSKLKSIRGEKRSELNFKDFNTQDMNPTDESALINNHTEFSNDHLVTKNSNSNSLNKNYRMHRILIMFTDLFINENVKLPDKELFLRFNFLGNHYRVKLGTYYEELDYCNINFFKMFYIICEENKGFIEYVEKNRHMEVQLGYYNENNINEADGKNVSLIFDKNIVIEDKDICNKSQDFVEFAKVELSLQGLKYGEKYRNALNGLMFKQDHPHYVAKLRCLIRISNEGKDRENSDKSKEGKEFFKNIDVSNLNCRKHLNFYIPPINFVVSDDLQDYWLELVERHKLRENILNSIITTMKKNSINFNKKEHKDNIFLTLETLVSHYLNKSTESESMNHVTSCHQVESTVLSTPLESVWDKLKSFHFHKFLSTHIKSVKFTNGSQTEVGSVFDVEYVDGSVWTFRILEISDIRHSISYEVISANPNVGFTSMVTFIKLMKVTEDNSTFISWETDFSNDVNSHIVQDQKFKKLDYFKDFKKHFTK